METVCMTGHFRLPCMTARPGAKRRGWYIWPCPWLASSAAPTSLQVPVMEVQEDSGDLIPVKRDGVDATEAMQLNRRPLCLTAGMYKGQLIVDLNADEENILGSSISVIVDDNGDLLGVHSDLIARPCTAIAGSVVELHQRAGRNSSGPRVRQLCN